MSRRHDPTVGLDSLVGWVGAVARAQLHRPALVDGRGTVTYRGLWSRAGVVARNLLASGVRPGQAVGLIGPNESAYVVNYLGITRAGCSAVPVSVLLDAASVVDQLNHVDAAGVVVGAVDTDLRDELAVRFRCFPMTPTDEAAAGPLPEVAGSSPCSIMLTSGSTGRPKGVVHTQATMLHAALQLATTLPYDADDRGVVFLPLYACIPEQVLPTLCVGGSLEILPGFDVEHVSDACTRATTLDSIPTILGRLIEQAPLAKLANLRWILFASEVMPVPLLRRWWEEFPGLELHQLYGMTEVLPLTSAPDRLLRQEPSTVGRPFATTTLTIGADGAEIVAASPARMQGYYRDTRTTEAALTTDGAFRTGDLGRTDERGLIFLTGRHKDIIISGGLNILPSEIETVACRHPYVERAVVVGVPCARWGETPIVVAVPRAGADLTAGQLLDHCRSNLAGYKRPSGAALIMSLPVTGIGKAAKRTVQKMITDGEIDVVRV